MTNPARPGAAPRGALLVARLHVDLCRCHAMACSPGSACSSTG
ncbi:MULTISPECIES: hypothetical protein [Streptomyces]|nr:hypothetical protein [Streptomyces sp. JHD 1]MCX2968881.1 hypothetical protein [Streptomyces sp. JHD 1]